MPAPPSPGQLTLAQFGASMPVDDPLFPAPPFTYDDARIAAFVYTTDGAAAARLVPSALQVVNPATASIIIASYGTTPFGPYNEAMQCIVCLNGQTPLLYVLRLVVDNVVALAAGREIWGFPKRFGHVTLTDDNGAVSAAVQDVSGTPICAAQLTVGAPIDAAAQPPLTIATLRVIPNPGGGPPEIAEIIAVPPSTHENYWSGTGASCQIAPGNSGNWGLLPVQNVIASTYATGTFSLLPGQKLIAFS